MSTKEKCPESPLIPSKRQCKVLTLAEKIQVIDTVNNGRSHHSGALLFGVGCTQVNTIIGQKEAIKTAYQEGMNASIKYLAPRNMQYPEIDSNVWSFFCEARSKCIPINGPMLQSEANESALHHNYNNFTASNGWLKSFCNRHQIMFAILHDESAEVCENAVEQWMQDLPNRTKNYELQNIFNCNETSIFFKALPKKTLLGPNGQPEGLKQSKESFSLLVCANAIGEKEKFLVIGKAKRPHSFPKYNSNLEQHIMYRSNKHG